MEALLRMQNEFVVHYDEVALKGNNRADFVKALKRNINRSLKGVEHETRFSEGRIFVDTNGDPAMVEQRLSRVFGISWFALVVSVPREYPMILETAMNLAKDCAGHKFKIAPKRADKSFSMTSHELAVQLGAEVAKETGMGVDLMNPDLTIHVDILKHRALIYSDRSSGLGGLPVGTAGRVVQLFSGGIDSPVAAWLLMKRGSRPTYLHFYLAPTLAGPMESKIMKLIKVLSSYAGRSTIVLCPFADYQLATTGVPADVEPSLFRRFMRMVAEDLAPRFEASAISTGDSLSQAASQTIWNLAPFDEGSSLPILRPLLTYDKDEIVKLARKVGTYELSLEEYKDCCAMITRHPRTRIKTGLISDYVDKFGLKELARTSIEHAVLVVYDPERDEFKQSPLVELPQKARFH